MTDETTAEFLGGVPSFSSFDDDTRRDLVARLVPRTLRGGDVLFNAGDDPDGLVITVRGRLGVLDQAGDLIATVARREVVGEIGALADLPRTSKVVALRDTEILQLDQASFEAVFAETPGLARSLSSLAVTRLISNGTSTNNHGVPATVAVMTIDEAASTEEAVDALQRVVPASAVVRLADVEDRDEASTRALLDRAEAENDLVVLLAGCASSHDRWLDHCIRQADAIVVVVPPSVTSELRGRGRKLGDELRSNRANIEVAVTNPAGAELGADAAEWASLLGADRVHHLRLGDSRVSDRFARLTTGHGVGLVFSGGAAKGLAHLGAWRALDELGVEVDAVAGVSLGALLGAGVALDYSPAELREEVEARLVRQKGLADPTFPWVAILRGEEVSRRIRDVARGRRFEQTWRSFVCTSVDLSTGKTIEHRTGVLWKAIRASLSIPGVFPPLRDGDRLLVDGAVKDNLPVASLRRGHPTPLKVIAIDVGKEGFLDAGTTPDRGALSGWSLLMQRLHPRRADPDIPTLARVLMRVVDLAGADSGEEPDVLIRPDLRSLRLSEFEQIDVFDRAGYEAVVEALG